MQLLDNLHVNYKAPGVPTKEGAPIYWEYWIKRSWKKLILSFTYIYIIKGPGKLQERDKKYTTGQKLTQYLFPGYFPPGLQAIKIYLYGWTY